MSARYFLVCATVLLLFANGASAARYQRTKDGKTLVWNNLRGVAQDVTWSGTRDSNGYATGEGILTWYRLGNMVNSYTGRMVHGKFDGPVIKEQGQTQLQATFVNGNKVGEWLEPGSTPSRTPSAASKEEPAEATETPPTEERVVEPPSPTPTLARSPSPLPTSSPAQSPTLTATPTPILTLTPTLLPTPLPSIAPSPVRQPDRKTSRLEEIVEGSVQDSMELVSPSPALRNALEEVPWPSPTPSPQISPAVSAPTIPGRVDATEKRRMVAELKKQTESVLAQVRDATGNFRKVERLEQLRTLPTSVSANVALLANQARDFGAKLGYETTFYEHLAEIETVDALTVIDEITRDLAAKDAPTARKKLSGFLNSYSEPSADNRKALWRYLNSAFLLCDLAKDEAATHLERAKSLDSAGKKSEALREYQEIYRIYPNPVTAEKIKQLEDQPR